MTYNVALAAAVWMQLAQNGSSVDEKVLLLPEEFNNARIVELNNPASLPSLSVTLADDRARYWLDGKVWASGTKQASRRTILFALVTDPACGANTHKRIHVSVGRRRRFVELGKAV